MLVSGNIAQLHNAIGPNMCSLDICSYLHVTLLCLKIKLNNNNNNTNNNNNNYVIWYVIIQGMLLLSYIASNVSFST